jgi:hypothetical protein
MWDAAVFAALDDAGHNGIRDEHIQRVANAILQSGYTEINDYLFSKICESCGIDSSNFTACDIQRLKEVINLD